MEDDLDVLPDVSFAESLNSINSSQSAKSKQNICHSPRNTCKRINDFREKIKQFTQYAENKKEMESIINTDGVRFDSLGQLVNDEISDDILLDENQVNLLNKLDTQVDPLIPYKPALNQIFLVEDLQAYSYLLPIETLSNSYKSAVKRQNSIVGDDQTLQIFVTNRLDQINLENFFSQIPNSEIKRIAIDILLLNCLTQKSSVKIISVFGFINSMLLENKIHEDKWYLGAGLMLKIFKFLGLHEEKINEYFISVNLDKFSKNIKYTETLEKAKYTNVQINYDSSTIELVLSNLISLLLNSLDLKKSLYSNEEIDLIFYLICLLLLDCNYSEIIGINSDLSILFSSLFEAYHSDKIEENMNRLSSIMLDMLEAQFSKDQSKFDNIFHQILYILSFLNDTLPLRIFKSRFTIGSVFLLLNSYKKNKISISNNIADLVNELKISCQYIFSKSSYSMYNLIEFLNIILDDLISKIEENKQNISLVENIKLIVSEANRATREAMELQGRAQVKVMITNFLYKCEYFLKKHSNKYALKPLNRLNRTSCNEKNNTWISECNESSKILTDSNFLDMLLSSDSVSKMEVEDPNETNILDFSHLAFL